MATTDPKTATEGQWQDLANRVQSKAEIGTVLSTPSSVAYVDTANLVDESVTAEKLGLSYSTSEQITGEKWIDGKTIYKKTVSCGALPNATTKNTPHGISNLYRVIKVEGYAISGSGTTLPLPVIATNDQYNVTISITSTNIVMETQVNRSGYSESYLTLYYTKNS